MFKNLSENHKIILTLLGVLVVLSFFVPKIMKNKSKMDIISIVVITSFIIMLPIIKFFQDIDLKKIVNNYSVTKGFVESYIITNKVSVPTTGAHAQGNNVKFSYSIGDNIFMKSYSEPGRVEIPDIKPDLSIGYLVIYEKSNPENSFILLNYPVKDDAKMKEYEELFQKGIPDNVFRNYKGNQK